MNYRSAGHSIYDEEKVFIEYDITFLQAIFFRKPTTKVFVKLADGDWVREDSREKVSIQEHCELLWVIRNLDMECK